MLDLQGINQSTVIYCENKNGIFANSQTFYYGNRKPMSRRSGTYFGKNWNLLLIQKCLLPSV